DKMQVRQCADFLGLESPSVGSDFIVGLVTTGFVHDQQLAPRDIFAHGKAPFTKEVERLLELPWEKVFGIEQYPAFAAFNVLGVFEGQQTQPQNPEGTPVLLFCD